MVGIGGEWSVPSLSSSSIAETTNSEMGRRAGRWEDEPVDGLEVVVAAVMVSMMVDGRSTMVEEVEVLLYL